VNDCLGEFNTQEECYKCLIREGCEELSTDKSSDYSVVEDDGQWWIMDIDFRFDNFDTKQEAYKEMYLLESMVEIEEGLYDFAKQYNSKQLNYFISTYNLYGMKDIWRSLLE